MSSVVQTPICLDVAVDHRIRRLFKPVRVYPTVSSDHVSRIKARGQSLGRPVHEIQVTEQLARPATKGGIAIMLQQPRDNHPFDEGLTGVIETCETLFALYDIFGAVSCDTLDIRSDITIVDLLPYVPENVASINDNAKLRASFETSTQVICDKEPNVLLCAGKIWLPGAGKSDNRKGEAWRFESIGLGERFGSKPAWPVGAKIRRDDRRLVTIPRVNGFHPSHAINYNSHVSLLRQLQILIGVETCGTFRGDWKNAPWMDVLRRRCQTISRSLSEVSSPVSQAQSPGRSPGRRNGDKYVPEYQQLYTDTLLELQNRAIAVMAATKSARSAGALYESLLSKGLSEFCNNASLILRQMNRLRVKGWPSFVASKNEAALEEAAMDTLQFANYLYDEAKQYKKTEVASILKSGATSVLDCVTVMGSSKPKYKLDLEKTCKVFLTLATNIEALLLELLLEVEEEELLGKMGQLRISKAPVVVVAKPVPAVSVSTRRPTGF